MAKKEELQKEEVMHVFPLWLYKGDQAILFKSKEHFEEYEFKKELSDKPASKKDV